MQGKQLKKLICWTYNYKSVAQETYRPNIEIEFNALFPNNKPETNNEQTSSTKGPILS